MLQFLNNNITDEVTCSNNIDDSVKEKKLQLNRMKIATATISTAATITETTIA